VVSQLVSNAYSTYEDTVVAGLHLQAAVVLNVCQLVNIALDSSTNYALIKHVTDDTPSNDPGWIRMDSVVLKWISNSISTDLHQVVRERGCTAPPLAHLDAAFRNFVQGDLSVSEYCRKFKTMAVGLADLDSPVEDRILILNILRGLN
jgi:phosphatidylglycerophosphatase A